MKNPTKQTLLSKRKARKQIQEVIKANTLFNEFLESINQTYPLHVRDEDNLKNLQNHLVNLNVHFVDVLGTIK